MKKGAWYRRGQFSIKYLFFWFIYSCVNYLHINPECLFFPAFFQIKKKKKQKQTVSEILAETTLLNKTTT